ncbi:MAG: regulatory protein RecX [Bdellovibrionales bacterium]
MPYKTKKRIYKKPTKERLHNAALFYLERYAASEESLRRVLKNKIRRAAMQDKDFAEDHETQALLHQEIELIIETHRKNGIINDKDFAAMKVASMRRAGKSARRITQSLAQKGIAVPLIETALTPEEGEDESEIELTAARSYARRRRLGPYRKEGVPDDPKLQQREVASLARAGFSFDVIKVVLGEKDFYDEPSI